MRIPSRYDTIFGQVIFPEMYRIHRIFDDSHIQNISDTIRRQTLQSGCLEGIDGKRIAVAVGSRGIANLPILVKTTVDLLREYGADVFIVPAMGSQSGAIAENQAIMLAHLGITEETMGVPVCSTMDVKVIGLTERSEEVFFDRYAAEADYTVSVVRVKPHTSFLGKYDIGIVKMNVIGLGNQKGAACCHHLGMPQMGESLERFGRVSIDNSNLLYSLAVIENAYEQTCRIEAVPKEKVMETEPGMLEEARWRLPELPARELDLLIVDEIGKNITGTGMDSNVVQRFTSSAITGYLAAKVIAFLDLTQETFGAASGMGLADITTRRAMDKIDMVKTYPNAITSKTPMAVRMPIVMDSDYDAVRAGLAAAYDVDYKNPRVIRIQNTLRMDEMLVSRALLDEIRAEDQVCIDPEPFPWQFDSEGNLLNRSQLYSGCYNE